MEEKSEGLVIHSDNFHGLYLIHNKFKNLIDFIHIDPPYNTSASEINYKNNYRDSSWLSLIHDRFRLGKSLLMDSGIQCTTIYDVENSKIQLLIEEIYEEKQKESNDKK